MPLRKPKILVVDDEEQLFVLIKLTMTPLGFEFLYCPSQEDFLGKIVTEKIDAAIVDYLMPGKNGMEVVAEIRQKPELLNFPIVFLTSKELLHDETKTLMALNLDYMRKPFVPQILANKLREVISRSRG